MRSVEIAMAEMQNLLRYASPAVSNLSEPSALSLRIGKIFNIIFLPFFHVLERYFRISCASAFSGG
jgi:hypothetical protein